MAYLPIEQIKEFLFADKKIREAIIDDYKIEEGPMDAANLCAALVSKLAQKSIYPPEGQEFENNEVFEAAVLAIASSSSKWVNIQNNKLEISETLHGYNPQEVCDAPTDKIKNDLVKLLPGQNQTRNAVAIIEWAKLLNEDRNFYKVVICGTYNEITKLSAWSAIEKSKHYPMAVLCLAGIFGNPVNRWKKLNKPKFPGMQVPITCEFLRNLGWSGFKPDRHVIRAIALWENALKKKHGDNVEKALFHIIDIIDTTSKTVVCPIKSAVYAIYATPEGTDYSEADNLLWAFISNIVNLRQKDIVNVWLRNQIDMDQSTFDEYGQITNLGIWPNSLICEE